MTIRSIEAFEQLIKYHEFETVLDVGCGKDFFYREKFRENHKKVYTNDIFDSTDYPGDFNTVDFDKTFDCIWCSHVLEHQLNANVFLTKIHSLLNEGGVLAISVPPRRDKLVGGHVSLWTSALLLYNLILAGFDCRKASVKEYNYDISVIVKKKEFILPTLVYDAGDIETLSEYFPVKVFQGFTGSFNNINWH